MENFRCQKSHVQHGHHNVSTPSTSLVSHHYWPCPTPLQWHGHYTQLANEKIPVIKPSNKTSKVWLAKIVLKKTRPTVSIQKSHWTGYPPCSESFCPSVKKMPLQMALYFWSWSSLVILSLYPTHLSMNFQVSQLFKIYFKQIYLEYLLVIFIYFVNLHVFFHVGKTA